MTRTAKLWRGVECLVLFVGLPLLVWYYEPFRLLKLLVLVLAAVMCIILMWRDAGFRGQALWRVAPYRWDLARILLQAAVASALMVIIVRWTTPGSLFAFPRRALRFWLIIMCAYPVVSALTQEFIYRTFFFHRYRPVFGSGWLLVVASAVLFGFLHIIYHHVLSVALTLVAGLALSWTYARTRSLALVSIEHALYGCAAFTIGLGHYFFRGH